MHKTNSQRDRLMFYSLQFVINFISDVFQCILETLVEEQFFQNYKSKRSLLFFSYTMVPIHGRDKREDKEITFNVSAKLSGSAKEGKGR
jgi:hypothetical protein